MGLTTKAFGVTNAVLDALNWRKDMAKVVITKGVAYIDGQPYKAFENTFTKEWYIVKGTTCMEQRVASGIKATSAKKALQQWIDSREEG